MDLHILEHRVRVLSLARRGLWLYTHPLLKLLFLPQRCRCKFFSLTETPEDYTIMLDEEGFKELPPSEFMQVADSTWLVLSVVSNGRAPSGCQATGVTKIARSVIAPLAEHHVSVLMLSTYQTDFILVRERDLPVVIHTLAGEFDIYKEESGECVPVTCDDVSNGFLKPKPAASPTLHPVQSPQTRFCVMAVAPDTLPAIATMLIDVLFYSHSSFPMHPALQPPKGSWHRQPGPRLHHLLLLLPHRGLHLHRDGRRNPEAVPQRPAADQLDRGAVADGADRRAAPRLRRVWHRGADRRAAGRR
ncbi:cytosolic arginine sensor for mTORC1 subunit 1 isoform X2 [Falco naumanni]|uniref:cytosolic arginine sensor for mTORC1 subunit 1 isoform X2 n=1 Tax=Falco naumanni TaxID=148594 RepID=UPI001ADDE7AC|nr:cytosolic arginine sensor for mTORC1 subunit 1 isoform X2 [Falco naumanni]